MEGEGTDVFVVKCWHCLFKVDLWNEAETAVQPQINPILDEASLLCPLLPVSAMLEALELLHSRVEYWKNVHFLHGHRRG